MITRLQVTFGKTGKFIIEYLLGAALDKEKNSFAAIEVFHCNVVVFIISILLNPWHFGLASAQSVKSQTDSSGQQGAAVVHHGALDTLMDTIAAPPAGTPSRKDTLDIITSEEGSNTVPGFRVQLMSTQNLSEAMDARARADSLLSDYDVYIIYDAPYYKIRAGDFRARYDASQAAGYIASHGFPDAWSVPDNVFRNPQKKTR